MPLASARPALSLRAQRVALILDSSQASLRLLHAALFAPDVETIAVIAAEAASIRRERLLDAFRPDLTLGASSDDAAHPEADPESIRNKRLILFTSGSQGEPKGVRHSFQTLLPAIRNQAAAMGLTTGEKQLLTTSPAHIIGLLGVLRAHVFSTPLYTPNPRDLPAIAQLIRREGIEHLHTVPTWLRAFLREWRNSGGGTLPFRSILLSGEPVFQRDYTDAAEYLAPVCRFIVGLGSTEVPTFCFQTWNSLDGDPAAVIPVGHAAADRAIRLDDGNLVVSGEDLWLGYADEPERTYTEFRSSDLARFDEKGRLHLLGRADRIVKISGFRANPADLEVALRRWPGIDEAFALATQTRLAAAYTMAQDAPKPEPDQLREFLATQLEPHLLPETLLNLGELPRTPGGKVDTHRVEALLATPDGDAESQSETYRQVRDIWIRMLPGAEGTPNENFYHLGGDSLLATQMCFAIESKLRCSLPLTLLLQYPRLRDLAEFVERRSITKQLSPVAAPPERSELTPGQRAIWFDHHRVGGKPLYHLIADYEIDGPLDTLALQRALEVVAGRHDAFRLCFGLIDGSPFVSTAVQVHIPLRQLPPVEHEQEIRASLEAFGREPFDLTTAPLARAALLTVAPGRHYFVMVFHHLIIDGNAFATLYRDLEDAYRGVLSKTPANGFSYQRHIQKAGVRAIETRDRALAFWRGHLPVPNEPSEIGDPADCRGADLWFRLPATLVTRLDVTARALQTTRFVVLLAAYQAVWMRLTGNANEVFGVPFSGRIDSELHEAIGFFVNALPIRARLSGGMSFEELVRGLKGEVTEIFDLQVYPAANLPVDLGRTGQPLFRKLFALQVDRRGLALEGTRCRRVSVGTGTAKVDVAFLVFPDGDELEVLIEYRIAAFGADQAHSLFESWRTLLEAALTDPGTRLSELPAVSADAKAKLRKWSGADQSRLGLTETLPDLLERWVRETPNAIAVRDTTGRSMTYSELWSASEHFARGIHSGERVICNAQRSLDIPARLLGITRAGAAYTFSNDDGAQSKLPPDTACIFHTSGTTGEPKEVAIPHRAIVRLVRQPEFARYNPQTVQLQLAPLAFDASTLEIWGPLANGGTVVFAPPGELSLSETARIIRDEGINTLWLTAGLFHLFADLEESWPGRVHTLITGGDVVSPAKARKVLQRYPGLHLVNGYGPTENTTFTCCHAISLADTEAESIPVGTPIRGTEVQILAADGSPLPPGFIGEISMAGDGLSANHLSGFYRSGDYGYWNESGKLMFCGRRDRQVKLRGYRIELNGVERRLATLPEIGHVALAVNESSIIAHYVPAASFRGEDALKSAARALLRPHEVPSRWVSHPVLPLTPQGKVDRRALRLEPLAAVTPSKSVDASNLDGDIERAIAAIWSRLLGGAAVSGTSDFFDLGGDSLLALRATLEMESCAGMPVPLSLLFQARTPRALAACIGRRETLPEFRHIVPLRAINSDAAPIFFIHGLKGCLFHLLPVVRELPAHVPAYGLQGDPEAAHGRHFREVAADYAAEIRRFRPGGPWLIAGYSLGGVIAHEVARQLQECDSAPVRLYIIDSFPQNLPAPRCWMLQLPYAISRIRRRLGPLLKERDKSELLSAVLRGFRRFNGPTISEPSPFDEAMTRLVPRPFAADATLFLAKDSILPLRFGWRYLVRRPLDVVRLDGTHHTMFYHFPGELARALAERYDRHNVT